VYIECDLVENGIANGCFAAQYIPKSELLEINAKRNPM